MDATVSAIEALATLRHFVCQTINAAPLFERRSLFDTRWPHDRFSSSLDSDALSNLRVCATTQAIDRLDQLSVNEYWGLQLLHLALSFSTSLPVMETEIVSAAELLRDLALTGKQELLLRMVNDGLLHELSADDLQAARDAAFIITDETWPYVEEQQTINPVFCL